MSALRVLLVVPLLLTAAAFLGISGAIVLRKRPLLIRGSLLAWGLLVVAAPIVLAMLLVANAVAEVEVTCLSALQIGVLAIMVWAAGRAMQGYLIIGTSEETFRDALRSALARLGLPFEETVMGFTLTSLHETLRTHIAPRLGSGQFQMKSSAHREIVPGIAEAVEQYLRVDTSPPEMVAAAVYGVAGLVVLVLAAFQAQRF
jgi:hypothetical protein